MLFGRRKEDIMRSYSIGNSLGVLVALTISAAAQTTVKLDTNSFGAIEARHIGPAVTSGRIAAIDGVASDPRIIYVGSAGGGVWKYSARFFSQTTLCGTPAKDTGRERASVPK